MSVYEDRIVEELNAMTSPQNVTVERLNSLVEKAGEMKIPSSWVVIHPEAVQEHHREGVLAWLEVHAQKLPKGMQGAAAKQIQFLKDAWK